VTVLYPYVRAATWVDGSTTDTAAKRNTIEDGIFNAHQQPAVRATANAVQSINNSTQTALVFQTESYDQAGGAASTQHDLVTNNSRLTCLYAGIYVITGFMDFGLSAAGTQRQGRIRVGGATNIAVQTTQPSASHGSELVVTAHYALAVNDYVELTANQDSGGALNVGASRWFAMVRVG
jgi:hypothetical protein